MTKVNSLKKLSKKIFGVEPEGDTVCEVLNNIGTDNKEIILKSSTPSSDKKFKITVIDNGTLTATEINE